MTLLIVILSVLGSAINSFVTDSPNTRDYHIKDDEIIDKTMEHTIIFAVQPRNVDILEDILMNVSYLSSPDYGKHKSKKEILELLRNKDGRDRVHSFLRSNGARVLEETLYGEYITACAPVKSWEMMLSTEFFMYKHKHDLYPSVIRARDYKLDEYIRGDVANVYNVNDFPIPQSRKPIATSATISMTANGYITLSALNTYYKIFTNTGNSLVNQSIFSALGQYYGGSDIVGFQNTFGIPVHLPNDPNGRNSQSTCNSNSNSCIESNLDLEYIMAVAQKVPTEIV